MACRIWSTVQQAEDADAIFDWYSISLLSVLEIWLGMIAATLPTLAPIASKVIAPSFSKLVASYRKHAASFSIRTNNGSRKVRGKRGAVPLPGLEFNQFDGESIVGFGNVQHWGTIESTRKEDDPCTGNHGDEQREGHSAITVRREYSVLAEPHQQV